MAAVSPALRDGIAAAQAQQFETARPLLERATAEQPDDPIGWFWLAIVSPSADAAIPCLRRVLAIDGAHVQAREALAKLLIAQAGAAASAGNRNAARELATEATELTPGAHSVWVAFAALSDDQNDRIKALRHASALSGDDPQIRTRLRQALLCRALLIAQTERAEARALFTEAAALDPDDARVWGALANLADTPGESLAPLRELLRVAPDHGSGRVAFRNALACDAHALAEQGRVDEACERWREAIAFGGGDVEAWLGLAAVTVDEDEARQSIEAAHQANPSDERVIAAMDRLYGPKVDPTAVEPPVDAFARFAQDGGLFDGSQDPLGDLDSSLDSFAQPAAPVPPPAAIPSRRDYRAAAEEPSEPPAADVMAHEPPVVEPAFGDPAPDSPTAWPAVEAAAEPAAVVEAAAATEPSAPESYESHSTPEPEHAPAAPAEAAPESNVPAIAAPEMNAAPAPETDQTAAAAPPAQPPASESTSTGSGRRTVMVVDDSPTIRKILGLTLERAGYKVVAEPDGESAIERLEQIVPDLILLDIAMPKIDGYEVCKRIKKDPRTAGVPVVMLSGKDAFFDKVKGHMAGATEYLTKPFETPAVLAVVTTHCQPPSEALHG